MAWDGEGAMDFTFLSRRSAVYAVEGLLGGNLN